MRLSALILITLFFTNSLYAEVQCEDNVVFSERQYVELPGGGEVTLGLNGVGLRTVPVLFFDIDVFYAALYLENKSSNGNKIIDSDGVKRSVVHALRFISKEDLVDNWNEEFERLCEDQCEELQPYHDQMLENVRDVNEDERLYMTHHSDRLELMGEYADGTLEEAEPIMSGDYSNLILRSFIGSDANNEKLKEGMLGIKPACE